MAVKAYWTNNTPHDPLVIGIAPAANDLCIAGTVTDGGGVTNYPITGWTRLNSVAWESGDGGSIEAWHKLAVGSESQISIGRGNTIGGVVSFGGVDTTTPLDVTPVMSRTVTQGNTYDVSITPVTNGCQIALFAAVDGPSGDAVFSFETVSGTTGPWTKVTDQNSGYLNCAFATCIQETAGAFTVRITTTGTGGTGGHAVALFALRPEASSGMSAAPVSASAVVSAPSLGQTHTLSAPAVLAGTPTVGAPSLGQTHTLSAPAVSAGTPTVGAPSLGQTHTLSAPAVSAIPTIGAPILTVSGQLSAPPVSADSTVSAPSLSQTHVLTASPVGAGASVSAPALFQLHVLTGFSVSADSSVSAPALTQTSGLSAPPVTGSSSVSAPSLSQTHTLTALPVSAEFTTSSPSLAQTHQLNADQVVGQSAVSTPYLTQGEVPFFGVQVDELESVYVTVFEMESVSVVVDELS